MVEMSSHTNYNSTHESEPKNAYVRLILGPIKPLALSDSELRKQRENASCKENQNALYRGFHELSDIIEMTIRF
jgi:hypothetical protein